MVQRYALWLARGDDPNGGTNYTLNASQQFRCVPFAALSRQALMLSDSAWVAEPFDNRVWSDSNYDVGIGTQTPQAKLHVAGNVRIADGTQAAGRVLTSDVDGDAVWSTVVSAGNYTATWTSTGGFTSAPTAPSCSYSRVGNVVHVVCRFGGAGPTYSAGTNTATLTVPPGLPIASPPNGDLVSGTFISDHYRNGAQTSVRDRRQQYSDHCFLEDERIERGGRWILLRLHLPDQRPLIRPTLHLPNRTPR
ncbi:MAG: hypothetical protein IPI41_16390 [Flavobacteriales bacterium]|nr:hypothetical protein [Flavobacteriales bacterium]